MLSIDPQGEIYFQPHHEFCYGEYHHIPFILFGNSRSLEEYKDYCNVITYLTHPLKIDPFLLLNQQQLSSFDHHWQIICGSISHIATSNHRLSKPFFYSKSGQYTADLSLFYWLYHCNISDISSVTYSHLANHESTSHDCTNIRQIEVQFPSNRSHVICLQDFFHELNNHYSSNSFVYFSSMGLSLSFNQTRNEMLWILQSFQNHDQSPTAATSSPPSSLPPSSPSSQLSLEILSVWRYILNDEILFFTQVHEWQTICLTSLLEKNTLEGCQEFLVSSEQTLSQRWYANDFLQKFFQQVSMKSCLVPFKETLLMDLLAPLLQIASPEYSQIIIELLFANQFQLKQPSRCLPKLNYDMLGIVNLQEESLLISSVTVHVLMFVRPEHLQYAEERVDFWNKACPQCNLGSHFVIHSIPSLFEPITGAVSSVPFGRIFLIANNYFDSMVVENDVVVVLIGLAAVERFIFPGGTGIIPHIAINHRSVVNLSNPLLFASQSESKIPSTHVDFATVDVHSFAGISTSIKDLFTHLLRYSRGINSEYFINLFIAYIRDNSEIIGLDTNRSFFNNFGKPFFKELYIKQVEFQFGDSITKWAHLADSRPDFHTLQMAFSDIHSLIAVGSLYESITLGWFLYLQHPDAIFEPLVSLLYEMARKYKFYAAKISPPEKKELNIVSESIFESLPSSISSHHLQHFSSALASFISSLYLDQGNYYLASFWFHSSLQLSSFSSFELVDSERNLWDRHRKELSQDGNGNYVIHFYTIASENNTELQNILRSARLSGIDLQVLGLGREYQTYTQKIDWYYEEIAENSFIDDNDLIMMVDAYDVIFTPAVRQIGKKMASSSTPMVACAEKGIYPELSSPWFYSQQEVSSDTSRYLNSGCLIGRAAEIKSFLKTIYPEMQLIRDDQQVFIRYMLRHPHLLSVDIHHELFQCGYKEYSRDLGGIVINGSVYFKGKYHPVGLFHCNNRASLPLYETLVHYYKSYEERYFRGRLASRLLNALHLVWDENYSKAKEILTKLTKESLNHNEQVFVQTLLSELNSKKSQ